MQSNAVRDWGATAQYVVPLLCDWTELHVQIYLYLRRYLDQYGVGILVNEIRWHPLFSLSPLTVTLNSYFFWAGTARSYLGASPRIPYLTAKNMVVLFRVITRNTYVFSLGLL